MHQIANRIWKKILSNIIVKCNVYFSVSSLSHFKRTIGECYNFSTSWLIHTISYYSSIYFLCRLYITLISSIWFIFVIWMSDHIGNRKIDLFGGLRVSNLIDINPKFTCTICKYLLLYPHQLLCCGAVLCRWCLNKGLSNR